MRTQHRQIHNYVHAFSRLNDAIDIIYRKFFEFA